MRWRMMAFVVFLHCSTVIVCAEGGVRGGSGYAPGVEGQALIWRTVRCSISPIRRLEPDSAWAQADTFVHRFGAWTGVSGWPSLRRRRTSGRRRDW